MGPVALLDFLAVVELLLPASSSLPARAAFLITAMMRDCRQEQQTGKLAKCELCHNLPYLNVTLQVKHFC